MNVLLIIFIVVVSINAVLNVFNIREQKKTREAIKEFTNEEL